MPGELVIFPAVTVSKMLFNIFMTCVCSYFDGDLPEEEKHIIEVKSEEEEEEVCSVQRTSSHKSQR